MTSVGQSLKGRRQIAIRNLWQNFKREFVVRLLDACEASQSTLCLKNEATQISLSSSLILTITYIIPACSWKEHSNASDELLISASDQINFTKKIQIILGNII